MGFAMADISWGRADQFGDFMTVLKLTAVNFYDSAELPTIASAVASTARVFPEPVGPRNRKFPIGRPTGESPARYV